MEHENITVTVPFQWHKLLLPMFWIFVGASWFPPVISHPGKIDFTDVFILIFAFLFFFLPAV